MIGDVRSITQTPSKRASESTQYTENDSQSLPNYTPTSSSLCETIPSIKNYDSTIESTEMLIFPTSIMFVKLSSWIHRQYSNYCPKPEPQVFIHAITILKKYTSKNKTVKNKLQCIAAVCLSMAAKYSNSKRNFYNLEKAVLNCQSIYTLEQMIQAQNQILEKIDFNLEISNIFKAYIEKGHHLPFLDNGRNENQDRIIFWMNIWTINPQFWKMSEDVALQEIVQFSYDCQRKSVLMSEMIVFLKENFELCSGMRCCYTHPDSLFKGILDAY